ncbi:DUF302 domain-containing protein [Aliamphritea spongicola]|uniref:DUF302 domain-containing protein n=1 Tax=Aliamphritea spongicola TaxID=707589 RepID=UPI00196AE5DD|nr:DUF302 domain-containing protein [Aliamphritea spongicola]MBN3560713.1 DUF302 domain-containing protein [Aliamphritea spongicola]
MKKFPQVAAIAGSILLATVALSAHADDGLIRLKSASSVAQTADKLEAVLKAKGMTVFTRINHTKGAESVGLSLRPTEVVVFGNPKIGTLLMNCSPQMAIDLPQKTLIQEDEQGQVWLSYNDPQYLAERHDIQGCEKPLKKVAGALNAFAQKATQ